MIFLFEIFQAEDKDYGLKQYTDRVCVTFESGDPGGESGEFDEFFSDSLGEWCGFDPQITARQTSGPVQFDSTVQSKYVFAAVHPGEPGAGITGFTDTVMIILESGDPDGDPGDFAGHLKSTLAEWYDGAKVTEIESE